MPDLFTNKFPLDGKIKLPVVRVSENERKIWFPPARKSVSTSRSKVIFQKLDFHEQKKAPKKKNSVSGRQKIGFYHQEWKIYFRTRFSTRRKNCLH